MEEIDFLSKKSYFEKNAIEVGYRKKTLLSTDEKKTTILVDQSNEIYIDFSMNMCCTMTKFDEFVITWASISSYLLSMTGRDIRYLQNQRDVN